MQRQPMGATATEELGPLTRCLEGEDPRTQCEEDAAHWISVYEGLIAFTRAVLDAASADPTTSGSRPGVQLLAEELERQRKHWRFWKERERQVP